jgi:hypothetical protein
MDIREIVQAVVGVLILKPDQVLINNALGNSVLFAGTFHASQASSEAAVITLFHPLLIILGLGLLIGMSLSVSTAIAFFVGIGAGAGLFEAGALLNTFAPQIAFLSAPFNGASNVIAANPVLSYMFIFFPVVVFSIGIIAWNRRRMASKLKTKNVVDSHMRHYCVSCGVHTEPGSKKCRSCGALVTKSAPDAYCTACGRPLSKTAKYCAYCGEEILVGGKILCASCGELASESARHCHNCGVRIPLTSTAQKRTTQAADE